MDAPEDLIEEYLDGCLAEEGRARLEAWLKDSSDNPRLFFERAAFDSLLGALMAGERATRATVETVRDRLGLASEAAAGKRRTLRVVRRYVRGQARRPRKERFITAWVGAAGQAAPARPAWGRGLALAAGVTIACVLGLYALLNAPTRDAASFVLAAASPDTVVRRGAASLSAAPGMELGGGDIVATADGAASVRFSDGTVLDLQAGSALVLPDATERSVFLERGDLAANVPHPLPRRSLLFLTPHATVRSVGTRFRLTVAGTETRLEVTEGTVELRRLGEDRPMRVGRGSQMLVRSPAGPSRPAAGPDHPTLFQEDFECQTPGRPLGAPWFVMEGSPAVGQVVTEPGNRVLRCADVDVESHVAVAGESAWTDYAVQADVRFEPGTPPQGSAALFAHVLDESASYRLLLMADGALCFMKRLPAEQGGRRKVVYLPAGANPAAGPRADTPRIPSVRAGVWHVLKFRVRNEGDAVRLEGKCWPKGAAEPTGWAVAHTDVEPPLHRHGQIGLYVNQADVSFDNVLVRSDEEARMARPPWGLPANR